MCTREGRRGQLMNQEEDEEEGGQKRFFDVKSTVRRFSSLY
jgi:hypothetical protein